MTRHMLGPHVVGQRVVIRYRLTPAAPEPTPGAPSLTDVLGVCQAWQDNIVSILTADGRQVEIAVSSIVSGKPVPPRPSPRLRVSSIEAEHRALALWENLTVEPLGQWLLRSAPALPDGGGVVRRRSRSNSVCAFGAPNPAFASAEAIVREYYQRLGQPALAQVEVGGSIEAAFVAAGWHDTGQRCVFQLASVAQVLRVMSASELPVALSSYGSQLPATAPSPGNPTRAVSHVRAQLEVRQAGADQAAGAVTGMAAVAQDWVGLHGLWTPPALRRQGHMQSVLWALLEWSASQGATTAYVQTLADNSEALNLYATLGFVTHHEYRYLTPS